jgi:hypothetical protein
MPEHEKGVTCGWDGEVLNLEGICPKCGTDNELDGRGPFLCPVCNRYKPFIEGSGDCQACEECCTDTTDTDGKTVYCHPY